MRQATVFVKLDDTGYSYSAKEEDLLHQQAIMCIDDFLCASVWVEPNTYENEWKFIKNNVPNWINLEFI